MKKAPPLPQKETPDGESRGSQNSIEYDKQNTVRPPDVVNGGPVQFNPAVSMLLALDEQKKGCDATPDKNLPIREVLEAIRRGDYAALITQVRAAPNDVARKRAKSLLPSFTASGVFNGHLKGCDPDTHSGLVQLDFDLKDNLHVFPNEVEAVRDRLSRDSYVFVPFKSPSSALKVLARITPDNQLHGRSYDGLVVYFKETYGLVADVTRNTNRLCFVSHDPDLRINESSVPFIPPQVVATVTPGKPAKAPIASLRFSIVEVRRALNSIPNRQDYLAWLKIANSVRDAVGVEAALLLLKEWSPEERPEEYKAKAEELDRVLAGTLFHEARKYGYFPEIYYENCSNRYYARDDRDVYRSYTRSHAADVLRQYRTPADEMEDTLFKIRATACVDLVLNVAGMSCGLHRINGCSVLVPIGPQYIPRVKGSWRTIRKIFSGALGAKQSEWFLLWLASSLQSYYSRKWQPAQVVAFIGPPGSCKSLIQLVLTTLFGGREARVMQGVTGGTAFNGDWAEATHLVVEDEFAENSQKIRAQVKEQVKAVAVNKSHRIHPKGKQAISITPFWRMTISCNPVPESLAVLPILDESVANKISLLWTSRFTMPMPACDSAQKDLLWDKIVSELPALVDELLQLKTVPKHLRDPEGRFTIGAFHHPTARDQIDKLTPEGQLLLNIFESIAEAIGIIFTGDAAQLLKQLEIQGRAGMQTARSLGRHLARYAQSHSDRVKILRKSNSHGGVYEISRPYDPNDFI